MNYKNEFTNYLQSKDYSPTTIKIYTTETQGLFNQIQKEESQIKKTDILNYLKYLKERRKVGNVTRKMHLAGLNHYFTFLYKQEIISENPCSHLKIRGTNGLKLYKIFTAEQLEQLFDNYYHIFVKTYDNSRIPQSTVEQSKLSRERNTVILSLLFNQGVTTAEIDRLLIQDIDLQKATVKIRGTKRSNPRNLDLKAEQIGLLIHYKNEIRPKFLIGRVAESEKLFLPSANKKNRQKANPECLMQLFKPIRKQVQKIEPHFINFKQVRASVITHWLKIHGLRKTQYMAGHRYIRGTENYLPNNLEDLTNDITKHHPF